MFSYLCNHTHFAESIVLLASSLTTGYPLDWSNTLQQFQDTSTIAFPTADAENLINAAKIGYCPLVSLLEFIACIFKNRNWLLNWFIIID